MDKPRVKPLEWEMALPSANPSYSPNTAQTPFGSYYANAHAFWFEGSEATKCPSRQAAKAAAQADYESRILAALEPVTVQEAARVLLGGDFSSPMLDALDPYNNDVDVWDDVTNALRALAERGE